MSLQQQQQHRLSSTGSCCWPSVPCTSPFGQSPSMATSGADLCPYSSSRQNRTTKKSCALNATVCLRSQSHSVLESSPPGGASPAWSSHSTLLVSLQTTTFHSSPQLSPSDPMLTSPHHASILSRPLPTSVDCPAPACAVSSSSSSSSTPTHHNHHHSTHSTHSTHFSESLCSICSVGSREMGPSRQPIRFGHPIVLLIVLLGLLASSSPGLSVKSARGSLFLPSLQSSGQSQYQSAQPWLGNHSDNNSFVPNVGSQMGGITEPSLVIHLQPPLPRPPSPLLSTSSSSIQSIRHVKFPAVLSSSALSSQFQFPSPFSPAFAPNPPYSPVPPSTTPTLATSISAESVVAWGPSLFAKSVSTGTGPHPSLSSDNQTTTTTDDLEVSSESAKFGQSALALGPVRNLPKRQIELNSLIDRQQSRAGRTAAAAMPGPDWSEAWPAQFLTRPLYTRPKQSFNSDLEADKQPTGRAVWISELHKPPSHRGLIWADFTKPTPDQGPNGTLSGASLEDRSKRRPQPDQLPVQLERADWPLTLLGPEDHHRHQVQGPVNDQLDMLRQWLTSISAEKPTLNGQRQPSVTDAFSRRRQQEQWRRWLGSVQDQTHSINRMDQLGSHSDRQPGYYHNQNQQQQQPSDSQPTFKSTLFRRRSSRLLQPQPHSPSRIDPTIQLSENVTKEKQPSLDSGTTEPTHAHINRFPIVEFDQTEMDHGSESMDNQLNRDTTSNNGTNPRPINRSARVNRLVKEYDNQVGDNQSRYYSGLHLGYTRRDNHSSGNSQPNNNNNGSEAGTPDGTNGHLVGANNNHHHYRVPQSHYQLYNDNQALHYQTQTNNNNSPAYSRSTLNRTRYYSPSDRYGQQTRQNGKLGTNSHNRGQALSGAIRWRNRLALVVNLFDHRLRIAPIQSPQRFSVPDLSEQPARSPVGHLFELPWWPVLLDHSYQPNQTSSPSRDSHNGFQQKRSTGDRYLPETKVGISQTGTVYLRRPGSRNFDNYYYGNRNHNPGLQKGRTKPATPYGSGNVDNSQYGPHRYRNSHSYYQGANRDRSQTHQRQSTPYEFGANREEQGRHWEATNRQHSASRDRPRLGAKSEFGPTEKDSIRNNIAVSTTIAKQAQTQPNSRQSHSRQSGMRGKWTSNSARANFATFSTSTASKQSKQSNGKARQQSGAKQFDVHSSSRSHQSGSTPGQTPVYGQYVSSNSSPTGSGRSTVQNTSPSMRGSRDANGKPMYDVAQIECPIAENGMERFACPSADNYGRYLCIDDQHICNGYSDCPKGEDEDSMSCMFYRSTKAHLDVLADYLLQWARGRHSK